MKITKMVYIFTIELLIIASLTVSCEGQKYDKESYLWEKALEVKSKDVLYSDILNEESIWGVRWFTDSGRHNSEILLFNGNNWTGQLFLNNVMLSGIYVLSEDKIWATGGRFEGNILTTLIYYYDGYSWHVQNEKQEKSGIIGFFALDGEHAWAVGDNIKKFNGLAWMDEYFTGRTFRGVAALDADDAWAVSESGMIYHFDGSSWNEQQQLRFPNDRVFISHARLYALDESHVWAALFDTESEITRIFFFDGSSWEEQLALHRTLVVTGIHALDEKHVWASCGSAFDKQCPILFFDGREWSIQEECDESLVGIKALGEDEILAVGESGSIYKGRKD
jgi:hypothetical protein